MAGSAPVDRAKLDVPVAEHRRVRQPQADFGVGQRHKLAKALRMALVLPRVASGGAALSARLAPRPPHAPGAARKCRCVRWQRCCAAAATRCALPRDAQSTLAVKLAFCDFAENKKAKRRSLALCFWKGASNDVGHSQCGGITAYARVVAERVCGGRARAGEPRPIRGAARRAWRRPAGGLTRSLGNGSFARRSIPWQRPAARVSPKASRSTASTAGALWHCQARVLRAHQQRLRTDTRCGAKSAQIRPSRGKRSLR